VFSKNEKENTVLTKKKKVRQSKSKPHKKSKRLTATTTGSDDDDSDYKDDEDDDSDDLDPRNLGWGECARRGRLNATTTNSGARGRPNLRPQKQ
jgi:hypothetical protein